MRVMSKYEVTKALSAHPHHGNVAHYTAAICMPRPQEMSDIALAHTADTMCYFNENCSSVKELTAIRLSHNEATSIGTCVVW